MKTASKILQKFFDIDFFKSVFWIACFFYSIPLTNFILVKSFKLFILWGAVVFLFNFFKNKNYTLKKADYLLFVFLILSFIGCLVNYKQNLFQNIISVAYLFIQTVMMISYNGNKGLEANVKSVKHFSNLIVGLTFPCAVLSVLIFLLNFKYSYKSGFQQIVFGVFEGRLWGIQGNPNSMAQFALVSIWFSLILLIIYRRSSVKGCRKGFLYANIVLETVCCVLSNSRSTAVGAFVSLFVFCLLMIPLKRKKDGQNIWRALLTNKAAFITKTAAAVLCVTLCAIVIKQGMLICAKPFENLDMNFLTYFDDSQEEEDELSTDREYLSDDYTNGRFELWLGAAKVLMRNPLFGVGAKNINENVNKYISEYTVAVTPKLSENMHNIYVQVLVANGILAFIAFAAYLITVIFKQLKFFFTFDLQSENNLFIFKLTAVFFCIICGLLVINLFDSNILYFCSLFLVPAFWMSISNINRLKDCIENENGKEKVLFVIDSLDAGGAEKALCDLTDKLDYDKYDVSVKALYNEGIYIERLNPKITYSHIIKKPGIWKKRAFYRLVKYLPSKLLYQLTAGGDYDAEIAFHELLSTKIISGSDKSSLKAAWIHTNIFSDDSNNQMFKSRVGLIKGYDAFDKIICVSDNIKKVFEDKTKLYQKTETIYNPIDIKKITALSEEPCDLIKKEGGFLIVSVGRLETVKGYHKLLRAFRTLKQKHGNAELWLIGDGSEKESYNKFISENGLEESVRILGFKENPYKYMKQADVFISASSVEGFSLAVAEALSLDLPVISTSTDGPKEILDNGKYGMLIPCGEEDIAAALENVLTDKALLNDLKNKSAERKKYFEKSDSVSKFDMLMNYKKFSSDGLKSEVFCTVFTPTFNRAYTLGRLYESLRRQSDSDFEWVVVDDGSTDNTEELFEKWSKEDNKFKITYLKTENGGKQRAVNKGLDLARGKMFFIVDSDDYLTDDAVEKLKLYEKTLDGSEGFAGVSGLRGFTDNTVIGSCNTNKTVDCTNLERSANNLLGDKAEAYYTELLKTYKFPLAENERFVTECLLWDKLAFDGYKIRWFNEIITKGDYLEDGLTNDGMRLYRKNPVGYLMYIRNEAVYYPFDLKKKIGNYYRYYLIVKDKKNIKQISEDLLVGRLCLGFIVVLNNAVRKIKGVGNEN